MKKRGRGHRIPGVEYAEMPEDIEQKIFDYIDLHDIPNVKWFLEMAGVDYNMWRNCMDRLRHNGFSNMQKTVLDAVIKQLKSNPDFTGVPQAHSTKRVTTTNRLVNRVISMTCYGYSAKYVAEKNGINRDRVYRLLHDNTRRLDKEKISKIKHLHSLGVTRERICVDLEVTPQEVLYYRKEDR